MTTVPPPRPASGWTGTGLGRGLGRLIPAGPPGPAADAAAIAAAVAALPLPADRPGTRWDPTTTTAAWLAARRSPHTRRAYFGDLADYLAWLDARDLDPLAVTRPDVDSYLVALRARTPAPSPATLNRKLATLSSWYRYLIEADLAVRNPALAVDREPAERDFSPTVGLTVPEVRAFLAAADAVVTRCPPASPRLLLACRDRAMLGLLAALGLRVGEATALDVADLGHDAGHRIVTITGKGGRRRRLPLPAAAARPVDAYLNLRTRQARAAAIWTRLVAERRRIEADADTSIFVTVFTRLNTAGRRAAEEIAQLRATPDDELPPGTATSLLHRQPLFTTASGARLTQAQVFALVRRTARAAGLAAADKISPHSLRHSAATAALDDGAALRDVQDFLGHADPRTTRRYDRRRGSLDRSPAHRLGALYAE